LEDDEEIVGLIDADILLYEIGAIEMPHPFLGESVTLPCSELKIEELLYGRIAQIKEAIGATRLEYFLTGKGNFRFEVSDLEPYKGQREGLAKPFHWETVNKLIRENFSPFEARGNEADDDVILRKRELESQGIKAVICSRDKDLRMEEGWHYSWPCGEHQPERPLYYISKERGTAWFYTQLLTGDSTDNIMGCGQRVDAIYKSGARTGQPYRKRKGVGPKRAENIIQGITKEEDLFRLVCGEYIKVFGPLAEQRLLEMGRLLYIGQTYDNQWELPYEFGT
jgi:hypothetical protein